jgi:23S rRNA (guanine1835-N2)-methyltransferase
MQSPFTFNNKQLSLVRFPVDKNNNSLQAWDAADEYIINHLNENNLLNKAKNILVFNDAFGALSLNCYDHCVFSVSDSFVSQQGLLHNQAQNKQAINLQAKQLTLLNSLDLLPDNIDIILYKIPKSKSFLIEQLSRIKAHYNQNVIFIAAAKAKDIHSSTLKVFEKYLGTTTTSLAVKKARLVFSQLDNDTTLTNSFPTVWPLEKTTFTLTNHANVFAREQLDLGARFFIQHLPKLKPHDHVIDLGCGNGVIGLSLLSQQQHNVQTTIQLKFIDESYMAIDSAKTNIENNLATLISQCQFSCNDCLTNITSNSTDLILCNPPFHQQQAITDHIAWQMFKDSHSVLKKGGELRIIGNRQLGYHTKLAKLFNKTTLIASNKKFVVIKAIK